jgi:hypothetical protein
VLPDVSWYYVTKRGKIYKLTTKYTKCSKRKPSTPNDHKICIPKFFTPGLQEDSKIGIFGMKLNHLATLSSERPQKKKVSAH